MGERISVKEFQKDLREMTLEEALIKHNLSFKDAMDLMPRSLTKKRPKQTKRWKNSGQYIQEREGKFYLRKWIDNKTLMFGTYKTLEDAQKVRTLCQKRGWIQENVNDYCKELGIEMALEQRKYKEKYE